MHNLHVLFLNAADTLAADVAVHVSIARALDRRAVRVTVATNRYESSLGISALKTFGAIPVLRLLALNLGRPLGAKRGFSRVEAIGSNAESVANLTRLGLWCRRNGVDIVHVTERPRQNLFGLYVAKLAGAACLVHAHTGIYPGEATRLTRWRLDNADAVVGVSRFTAASYTTVGRVPPDRVFAVHNAVDPNVFTPEIAASGRGPMRERLGIPADTQLIGCIARMTRWKAQHVLLDAFAQVHARFPRTRLALVGLSADSAPDGLPGGYRGYLVRRTEALGLTDAVCFPGFISQADMPEFYGALDVLAHPALEEPFGLVLVEAMASQKPVVAVDGGGVPEIITSGRDGYLVPANAASPFADALLRLLEDPAHAADMARAGRKRVVEAFTPELQAQAMLRIYEQVVARRGHTPGGHTPG
jgi:glycosyltransferase involved in cell wall biosynthesis